jgi:hypothetical protein
LFFAAHDAEVDQVAQQDRARPAEDHVDRVVVDLAHFFHAGDVDLHGALRLQDAVVGEDHVVGRERRAVLELDALAQVEAVLGGRNLLPARRQAGFDPEVLGVAHQALVGVLHDAVGGGVVLRMRVEGQDVVLRAPLERCGMGHRRECDQRRGQQVSEFHCVGLPVYLSGSDSSTSAAR